MKFSERIGKTRIKIDIQIESMDQDLKYGLWNAIQIFILDNINDYHFDTDKKGNKYPYKFLFIKIWLNFLKYPLDSLGNFTGTYNKIREWFMKWEWYQVYDFIEFLANNSDDAFDSILFTEFCNDILENELSAYRFVDNQITKITDEIEIDEIEKSINNSKPNKLKGVNIHLKSALDKLSDRKNPDYRNSIKESISAVESMAEIISEEPKAELGKALNILENKINLHGALKAAFKSLYGYTSDENGIRHAILEEPNLGFEDAKYMLVSCSAFINYLIIKSKNSGIKLK